MKIQGNGMEMDVPESTTVRELLGILEEPESPDLIVEVKGRFIHMKDYDAVCLAPGDRVEVIHLDMGG